jgi:hypothetical protein
MIEFNLRRTLSVVFACTYGWMALGQSASKTMHRLPDTGQTSNYTATFGEDSDYNFNPPFFVHNGDGTVTDTVTGLMWQETDGGEMTVENTRIYCAGLTLGGYSDWRLPTAHEAFSILNHDHANPAIDPAVFTTTAAEYWWTSTRQANDTTKIWVTNAGGGIGNHPKSETVSAGGTKKFHVRAVRDIQTPVMVASHFTVESNGTILDNLTGLVWQKVPYSDTLTWEKSLQYADTLTLANFTDWRLPNIKELQSINDEGFIKPSLNTAVFGAIGIRKYWSSTSLPNQTTKAWYLDTQYGITTYDVKTIRHSILCVRGISGNTTAISEISYSAIPVSVYPNPFQGSTRIQFAAPEAANGSLRIVNVLGETVFQTEVNASHSSLQIVKWEPKGTLPGIYFYAIDLKSREGKRFEAGGRLCRIQ